MRLAQTTLSLFLSTSLALGACSDDTKMETATGDATGGSSTNNPPNQWGDTSQASDAPSSWDSSSGAWDTATGTADAGPTPDTTANTHISFGGAQDFGYVRGLIAAGRVPQPPDLDPAGFFAEHSTPLPDPVCGQRICVQAMLGVMGNLMNGRNCTMLQLGLNSPIAIVPEQRPPLTLAIAVDVSGSMATGDKIGFVRQGLRRLVSELNDDDRLAIITYSNEASVVWPMQDLRSQRNAVLNIVDGLAAQGGTNLHNGLQMAYQAVGSAWESDRQNRVIMLSDGMASSGITDDAQILAMSAARNSDGIGLTTVGLGTDFNIALMRGLAEQADGNFYFLENSTAVDEVFTEELAYFTLPVAFDVTLDVRAGPAHTVTRASGSNKFVVDATGGKLSIPSVFFAHRLAHDDVFEGEDGPGRRGGGSMLVVELMPLGGANGDLAPVTSDVANVTLTWRDPGESELKTDSVTVRYPFSPGHLEPTGFFESPIVTKSFVVLNIYFAIESAVTMFHGDRAAEARDILERVIAAALDYEDSANDGEGDIDIRFDIELMEDLLDLIVARSTITIPPAPIPEDPWPHD